MIIKIKSFSGENLYLSEEDYLDEIMYSSEDEDLPLSNKDKAKLGMLGATGVGLATAGTGHLVRRSGVNDVHGLLSQQTRNLSPKGTRRITKDSLKYAEALYKVNPKVSKDILKRFKDNKLTPEELSKIPEYWRTNVPNTPENMKKAGKGIKKFIGGGQARKAGLIAAGLGGLGYAALKLSDREKRK